MYDETGYAEKWQALADHIHRDICMHGADDRGVFVQRYGDVTALDASVLLMPLVGFLPSDDERLRYTIDAIANELTVDGLVGPMTWPALLEGSSGGTDTDGDGRVEPWEPVGGINLRECSSQVPDSSAWTGDIDALVDTTTGTVVGAPFNAFLETASVPINRSPCDAARVLLHLDRQRRVGGPRRWHHLDVTACGRGPWPARRVGVTCAQVGTGRPEKDLSRLSG